MSQRRTARANLSQSERGHGGGGASAVPKDDIVQDLIDELDNKLSKNEHEKNAIAVAKVLGPILSTAITRSMMGTTKMQSAIRKNCFDLDTLQQYGRRENLRISGLQEEEGENLKTKVLKIGQAMGIEVGVGDINVVHRSGPRGGGSHVRLSVVSSPGTKRGNFL